MGGLRFAVPEPAKVVVEKPKREKQPTAKCDPRLAAMARELRDRWLERASDAGIAPALPRYEVTRAIGDRVEAVTLRVAEPKLLAA